MELTNSPIKKTSNITPKEFKDQPVTFTIKQTEIDYFRLLPELFSPFEIPREIVDFQGDRYLNVNKHLRNFDYSKKETVVFNFQTGKGKTQACYKLIQHYLDSGYYVIVCSPFRRLVEKDYLAISSKYTGPAVFNYLNIKNEEVVSDEEMQEIVEHPAHIMTINCLMQNPGKKHPDQSLIKRRYLNKLKEQITKTNNKVVFFFDELHKSIECFDAEFLPNLLEWEDLTYKCFVSSATFTPASIPVIRYISYLTTTDVRIYEAPRSKNIEQARLHLHFTGKTYSGEYLSPLTHINALIKRYKSENRKINILAGHKTIIDALTNPKKKDQYPLIKSILELSPNILTADTPNNVFNTQSHNIGTTFTTGIDIDMDNAVLIIILPSIEKNNQGNYGVFTDGVPALIQSISRVRKEGDIHIFMLAPHTIIELDEHKDHLSDVIHSNVTNSKYHSPNDIFKELERTKNFKENRSKEGYEIVREINKISPEMISLPTFHDYLVRKSDDHIVNRYVSMGKYLSPYILWASINNQFCNATLNTITYPIKYHKDIRLTKGVELSQLLALLKEEQINLLRSKSYREGFKELPNHLDSSIERRVNTDGEEEKISYKHLFFTSKDKPRSISVLRKNYTFNNLLLSLLYLLKAGEAVKEIDRDIYFRTCINNASNVNAEGELPELYKQFGILANQFVQYYESRLIPHQEKIIIHKDFYIDLPTSWLKQAALVIKAIKKKDDLIGSFSFLQGYKFIDVDNITANEIKAISNFFEGCFINVTDVRVDYGKQRGVYYIVNDQYKNNTYMEGIDFIEM